MPAKTLLLLCLLFPAFTANAQLIDSFDDGNFTENPVWTGNVSDWTVNASGQLQSNDTAKNGTFYLSTASKLAMSAEWELTIRLAFNTSSTNYVDVYLTASAADLTQKNTSGYFVRLGNTSDNICLYRKDPNGATSKLIDGMSSVLNSSNNVVKLKITRDDQGTWMLYRDLSGSGNNYYTEGMITDKTDTASAFFGIFVKQSTSSFFKKHFFDDIIIKPFIRDIIPPSIQSVTIVNAEQLDVQFNEPVDRESSSNLLNYRLNNGLDFPVAAVSDTDNPALVHLFFAHSFPDGVTCQAELKDIKDLSGNILRGATASFVYYVPKRYDIVIDEIMADPEPVVGLPDAEWIELKNTSSFSVDIGGWYIGKPGSQSVGLSPFILQPDSFVVVCSTGSAPALADVGVVLPVKNFPSLANAGDELILYNAAGMVMHAVNYTADWYQNALKKNGGWSLEMVDTKTPCSGAANWKASTDEMGGTPGQRNAVATSLAGIFPPKLLYAYATNNRTINLIFNEPLDSVIAADNEHYIIGGLHPVQANPLAPLFDQVQLYLATPLSEKIIYTVAANGVTDCSGNLSAVAGEASVGLSETADSFDVVINEVLFNPKPGGVDYVELYNRSDKIIDLNQLYIANRNSENAINSITSLCKDHRLLFPKSFTVLTEDPSLVQLQYMALNPDAFLKVGSMPSYNDDKGEVVVLNEQGSIVDELQYSASWHFPLISNPEGVALERISDEAPTQQQDNWHSAASSAGYGTPTYINSQTSAKSISVSAGAIAISPTTFSPDNDGRDDYAIIGYDFPAPGYVMSCSVFDAAGRPVRSLLSDVLCGRNGQFQWDGLNDRAQQLPSGVYVVFTSVFTVEGETQQFKNIVVLARKHL